MDGRFDHGFAQLFTTGEDHTFDQTLPPALGLTLFGALFAVLLGLCLWSWL